MERAFKRHLGVLEDIFSFVSEFVDESGIDSATAYALNLAIEELFVNMVRYNPDNPNDIVIGLEMDRSKVIASLTDFGANPLDINGFRPYDAKLPLADRKPGGLGIHLVRAMMDDVTYEYRDGTSKITLTKRLGKAHV
jgi:serine/threonine-protein kinase RsbW